MLGEPGNKGLKELFVGTAAERVVRQSDRPVLIVKQAARDAYRRVLVAVDFSEGAARARGGLQVAPGAQYLVVHAWQVPPVGLATREAAEKVMEQENRAASRRRVERQAREHLVALASPPQPPRIEMTAGDPFFVIREAIASFQPDLMAMGTHARSGIAIAMVGRLAREFLVEAPCDVLVARA